MGTFTQKSFRDSASTRKLALVVGNEVGGVSGEALGLCAQRVRIPMAGRKASLNVAVAFGIVALEIRRRWLASNGDAGLQ